MQLAGDLDRGHVFTDRILNRRGQDETLLLGAATIRPLIERLVPKVNYISRHAFSKLVYGGQKKLTRLPSRTAIVAFSSEMVYAMAELIRRQRGGAAVILGALSRAPARPDGAVPVGRRRLRGRRRMPYAWASTWISTMWPSLPPQVRRFSGFRQLTAAELGQIAGRAGRYMNDGAFWVTARAEPFEPELVEQLESLPLRAPARAEWGTASCRSRHCRR